MAISKVKKQQLATSYTQQLDWAIAAIVFNQLNVSVNELTQLRKLVRKEWWKLEITKKRVFLRTIESSDYQSITIEDLWWSIGVLYSLDAQNVYWPLKAMAWFIKAAKKDQKKLAISYNWWWFDKQWHDKNYITEIASLPSREELISKFMFLVKYPVQGFTQVLDQIAKK